jgi:hypothetical protein
MTARSFRSLEGKVNEPFDRLVSEWLEAPQKDGTPGPNSGRKTRLTQLCDQLELEEEVAKPLRYQLLHRTAAALIEAQRFTARHALMLVHSFSPTDTWFADYAAVANALGVEVTAPDSMVSVRERQGVALYLGWVKGEPAFLNV